MQKKVYKHQVDEEPDTLFKRLAFWNNCSPPAMKALVPPAALSEVLDREDEPFLAPAGEEAVRADGEQAQTSQQELYGVFNLWTAGSMSQSPDSDKIKYASLT